jgi:UDP:flavonoid glycosyltransferase YjiC (YdhE family)
VAVTQGTLANRDLSELIEPALAGLAGMGGTQQAIAARVPVIVAGVTEDKPAVAARAAYHGLGIDLQTATPAPEAVTAAVESVLQDDGMRENVRQFAQVYAAHDPFTEIGRLTLA